MTTSGTFAFTLTVSEMVEEAFERCGKLPSELKFEHLNSARRSFNLMFADWSNKGVKQWAIERYTQTVTIADVDYALPTGGIDILSMVVRRDSIDTPMVRISREEYLELPDKTLAGRPSNFFVDRRINTPIIYLWNAPENSTDQIIYDYIRRLEDVGSPTYNVDTPYRWTEAVCAGLAAMLCVKFAPERLSMLKMQAMETFDSAFFEDRDRASTVMDVKYDRGYRA